MRIKYTPGLWRLGPYEGQNKTAAIRAGEITASCPYGEHLIALVNHGFAYSTGGDPVANGYLISAAPDLQDACYALLDRFYLDNGLTELRHESDENLEALIKMAGISPEAKMRYKVILKARAALKKGNPHV